MKDVSKLIDLGLSIVAIILVCLYIGHKTNNYLLWIIVGIVLSLCYLFSYIVKKL